MAKKKEVKSHPARAAMETPQQYYPPNSVDKQSLIMGALAGGILVAIILYSYFAFYAPALPPAYLPQQPQAPPTVPPAKPSLPSSPQGGIQIQVKNNERVSVRVLSVDNLNSSANGTGTLEPGESANLTVEPCETEDSLCYGQIVINYVIQNVTVVNQTVISNGSSGEEPQELAISTPFILAAVQDQEYGFALEAIGGTGSYSWTVYGLPERLAAGQNGFISGVPLSKGSFVLQVSVSDGQGTAVGEMLLVVQ